MHRLTLLQCPDFVSGAIHRERIGVSRINSSAIASAMEGLFPYSKLVKAGDGFTSKQYQRPPGVLRRSMPAAKKFLSEAKSRQRFVIAAGSLAGRTPADSPSFSAYR